MGPAVQMQWVPVPTTLLSIFTSSGTDTSLHYSNPMGGHSWIIKCCSHVLGASPGSVHHSHNVIYLSEPWRGHFCVSRGVEEKKCILIYGGHCFGVGGWECAMAFPSFFFFLHCSGAELLSGKNDCAACLHCKPNWWPVHLSARWKQWTAKEIYSVYMTVGLVLHLTSKPMH